MSGPFEHLAVSIERYAERCGDPADTYRELVGALREGKPRQAFTLAEALISGDVEDYARDEFFIGVCSAIDALL